MSTIPQLKLYPLYSWGKPTQATSGLNADSAFSLRSTSFNPAYGINTPPKTDWQNRDSYFSLTKNQTLSQQPINQASEYTKSLAFDGNALGGLKTATVPATAPQTPSLYQNAVSRLSISDMKFSDLMNQPEFHIPRNGMGIKVTTDGLGNVDTMSLDPSLQGTFPRIGTNDPSYTQMNRSEIMFRATRSQQPEALPGLQNQNPPNANLGNNRNLNPLDNNLLRLQKLDQARRPEGLEGLQRPNDLINNLQPSSNAILQRLLQMQPPDNGLNVTGFDSVLDPAQSRQIAVSQAGFDVAASPQFKENLAALKTSSLDKGQIYQPNLDNSRMMDGRIPTAPFLSAPPKSASESGLSFANQQNPFNLSAGVEDTASKKGGGGLSYFRMDTQTGSGGMASGSGMPGGGQSSPFASAFTGGGDTQQQPQERRRPLRYFA